MNAFGTNDSVLTGDDIEDYLTIVDRLVAYYDSIEFLPGMYVVGSRIKGEAGADLSGMQIVLAAVKNIEGFNYVEFFRYAADMYAAIFATPDVVAALAVADTHPMNYLRTNVNIQMYDELYETFGIQEGDGMYLDEEDRIVFWGK